MSRYELNIGLARQLCGGVIMDVVNSDQAKIAENSGACAVMALERVPADIRSNGGVARMSDPKLIEEIRESVTIPVMAKCRIGHIAEARMLESIGVDFIDESEVLTPADEEFHLPKHKIEVPTVCGARNLGEALRRIDEGAALLRTKGEAGTGNVVEAVRHMRLIKSELKNLLSEKNISSAAKEHRVSEDLIKRIIKNNGLTVPNFAAGGIATPADASLMMTLGAEAVFVGSGIFKSENPPLVAKAIVDSVNHWNDAAKLVDISRGLGEPMKGLDIHLLKQEERLQERGV
ncbi:pyridoxal 5'-phosphate synthase lyase subunit PdxS [bacterium]|nr:pyridoxal 5'-phosphate synthase lyase subunit PdxS [bacterium]|tara:strand:- start:10940 stop:11809 length:870 start_codon:yes stop_codon:yes gene_type:complete